MARQSHFKVSQYSKAVTGGFLAAGAALGGFLSDGKIEAGEWLMLIGAFIVGAMGVAATKNTVVVRTGEGTDSVTTGIVISNTGEKVGEVVADTGAATGGIIAGTTGVVGSILDATVGKLIPGK